MCEVFSIQQRGWAKQGSVVQSSAGRKQCYEVDHLDVLDRQKMAGGVQQQASVSEARCIRNGCGIDDVMNSSLAMPLVMLLVVLLVRLVVAVRMMLMLIQGAIPDVLS